MCTALISSEFDSVSPFMPASKEEQNSRKDERVGPSCQLPSPSLACSSSELRRTERMAWVAHAF